MDDGDCEFQGQENLRIAGGGDGAGICWGIIGESLYVDLVSKYGVKVGRKYDIKFYIIFLLQLGFWE